MTTDQQFLAELKNGRIPVKEDLSDRFFDYLRSSDITTVSAIYNSDGILGDAYGITLSADQFTINGSQLSTDGLGHVLDQANSPQDPNITFENALGVIYDVALHYVEGPSYTFQGLPHNDIVINSRTQQPHYEARKEYIGERGDPDAVSIAVDDIVLVVDSLCELGVSHAGRKALVYLKNVQALDSSVGMAFVDVTFSGGQNKVTVISTKLGQSIASLDPAVYEVIILGPTVRRNTPLLDAPGYVCIAQIEGGGAGNPPLSVDISCQNTIKTSLSDIESALEGFAQVVGSAAGRAGPRAPRFIDAHGSSSVVFDQRVYVFGGSTSLDELSIDISTSVYVPNSDAWDTRDDIPDGFGFKISAAKLGNLIYVAGGKDNAGYTDAVRRYDPSVEMWLTNAAPLPAPRSSGTLVTFGSVMYYFGGDTVPFGSENGQTTVYKYNEGLDSWSQVADMPFAKANHGAAVLGDKIYLYGGGDSDSTPFLEFFSYSPGTDQYEILASPPLDENNEPGTSNTNACLFRPAFVENRGVLHAAFGGGTIDDTVWSCHVAYSTVLDQWVPMPRPSAPYMFGATTFNYEGALYVFGGIIRDKLQTAVSTSLGFAVDVDAVRIAQAPGEITNRGGRGAHTSSAFTQINTTLTDDRIAPQTCVIGPAILIAGGKRAADITETADLFFPDTHIICRLNDMPDFRAFGGAASHSFGTEGRAKRAIVLGGEDLLGTNEPNVTSFNPALNSWTVDLSAGPTASQFGKPLVIGHTMYLMGGIRFLDALFKGVQTYNMITTEFQDAIIEFGIVSISGHATCQSGGVLYSVAGLQDPVGAKILGLDTTRYGDKPSSIPDTLQTFYTSISAVSSISWDSKCYFFGGGDTDLHEFDPRARTSQQKITGGPSLWAPGFEAVSGGGWIFGGSSTAVLNTPEAEIYHVSIEGAPISESAANPWNFISRENSDSVGFFTGDLYGNVNYNEFSALEYVVETVTL